MNQTDAREHNTMNNDTNKEQGGENEFYSIQRPLINLIEEYLLINSFEGKRMTIKRFCELSGVPAATMTAILTGNRWVAKCNRDTVEKLATTLKIPILQVYILAGFIRSSDMLYSSGVEEIVHNEMNNAPAEEHGEVKGIYSIQSQRGFPPTLSPRACFIGLAGVVALIVYSLIFIDEPTCGNMLVYFLRGSCVYWR